MARGDLTDQTVRDRARVAGLAEQCSPLFAVVGDALRPLLKPALIAKAEFITRQHGAEPIGRIGRRQRKALIAWFCRFGHLDDEIRAMI
jgi:hypothetical protein